MTIMPLSDETSAINVPPLLASHDGRQQAFQTKTGRGHVGDRMLGTLYKGSLGAHAHRIIISPKNRETARFLEHSLYSDLVPITAPEVCAHPVFSILVTATCSLS